MQKAVKGYLFILEKMNKLIEIFLAIALSVMTVVIFWQVFSRYVIGSATSWSEELARILMIYLVLLGSALAVRKGQMLAVNVINEVLKEKHEKILQIIVHILSIIFYLVLLFFGLILSDRVSGQSLQGLGVSMFWMYVALPLGGLFLTANSVGNILELLKEGRQW